MNAVNLTHKKNVKWKMSLWAATLMLLLIPAQPLYATQESEEEESSSDEMDIRLSIVKACVRNDVAKAIERHEDIEDALGRYRLQSDIAEAQRRHEDVLRRVRMENPKP